MCVIACCPQRVVPAHLGRDPDMHVAAELAFPHAAGRAVCRTDSTVLARCDLLCRHVCDVEDAGRPGVGGSRGHV